MSRAFLLFHLNLAYSSIEASQHPEVIRRCYWPLLELARHRPLGIELSGWTLERIAELDPGWIATLRERLEAGRCELVGSGYTQMIGPLVPWRVNRWNQHLGIESYRRLLGRRPELVLVNEKAYGSALVPLYREAGYRAMVMDRDNVCLALGLERGDEALPAEAEGPGGERLPVLWTDSIMFQKLQRYAHGDIALEAYLGHFRQRLARGEAVIPLYGNDAEVFDFRPGRFREEAALHPEGEWRRIQRLLERLEGEGVEWVTPGRALALQGGAGAGRLNSIAEPLPVKKQAKYNITRWALSGRGDLWLNTLCQRIARHLGEAPEEELRRRLCRLWASDLRTHIVPGRWREARREAAELLRLSGAPGDFGGPLPGAGEEVDAETVARHGWRLRRRDEGILLTIETGDLALTLNLRRGLAIDRLAFRDHHFTATVGTLPHGYFHSIALGADFYSNLTVVELPADHCRLTDLERVEPRLHIDGDQLRLRAAVATPRGAIEKEIVVPRHGQWIECAVAFPGWERPHGSVRVGAATLLPEAFEGPLEMAEEGDPVGEHLLLDRPCHHGRPVSVIVSAATALGGVGGAVVIGDRRRRIRVSWDPAAAAVLPMLQHQPASPAALTRLTLSLGELDETFREGGPLPLLRYRIEPA